MDKSFKYKMYSVIGLIVIIVAFSLIVLATRIGKVAVDITVSPSDASLTINGDGYSAGKQYLKPGVYHFKAAKDGWLPDERTIHVTTKTKEINLIATPNSDEARKWLDDHPYITLEREGLAGQKAQQEGLATRQKTPIINLLPYTYLGGPGSGPFQIDYGVDDSRPNGVFLLISYATPSGRKAALDWIRSNGFDPTNLDIRFKDFNNPLLEKR